MGAVELFEHAKALPLAERLELARRLWDDLEGEGYDPDLTPGQAAELNRRLAEFEKNPEDGIPWETVKAEVEKRFSRK